MVIGENCSLTGGRVSRDRNGSQAEPGGGGGRAQGWLVVDLEEEEEEEVALVGAEAEFEQISLVYGAGAETHARGW